MELGKVQNLRLACARFDRVTLEAHQALSFWRQVGRCTRRRGYVVGRQLQEGCLVPAIGGGICQLSNAIYQVAMDGGLTVLERHTHSRAVPGSAAERGQDATVAWNYVDLRLEANRRVQFEAQLTQSELVVRLRVEAPEPIPRRSVPIATNVAPRNAQTCDTCNEVNCFRYAPAQGHRRASTVVVDAVTPEWLVWLDANVEPDAALLAPLDGSRWNRPQYAWPTERFGETRFATALTLWNAWRTRRMPATGGARQAMALERAGLLAAALVARVPYDARDVVVAHEFLPFAWIAGALGGRRFTVLQGRPPMAAMQVALDSGAVAHPETTTFDDFRAPADLIAAENAALAAATQIITAHTAVAAEFGARAHLAPWILPDACPWLPGPAIAFGGPTVGRKGAFEVREAVRILGIPVVVQGGNFEGADFWTGLDVTVRDRSDPSWMNNCFALVQPSLVEERPRALLQAKANGVPTIATAACGVEPTILIPPLSAAAIVEAVRHVRNR
ncbi:MAG: VanW family protein [Fimbriimonadaceae bacterium]